MVDIHDYDIRRIEREVIDTYNAPHFDYTECTNLLSLRKDIINNRVLAHQKDILPDIIAFNDALTNTLRDMYNKAHKIWNTIKDNKVFGSEPTVTAKCFLGKDYPSLHPVQDEDRQDLWDAICDTGWNRIYDDGIALPELTLPDYKESFNSYIGIDCTPLYWNEGLDRELTRNIPLTSAFHNLFEHMEFAITDFIYVREFRTEINIEVIEDNKQKCFLEYPE